MIKIELSVFLGIGLLATTAFFFWMQFKMTQDLLRKERPSKNVRQCTYCSHVIEMEKFPDIWICPVCKSYVET